jgi:hypothetical protein
MSISLSAKLVKAAAAAAICLAAMTGATMPATAQGRTAYTVAGFRDVKFGMTEPQVRAAATKTFNLKPADFASAANPLEGTTVLTAKVAGLEPGPGPARVAYIFGHTSKKLVQVNVVWGEEGDKPLDVNAVITSGTQLSRYFNDFAWKKDARAGIPLGDNAVVLFAGDDDQKGSVRVVVDGVKYQFVKDGTQSTSPEPKGPPKLVINYIADRDNPDVMKIEKGKF